MIRLIERRQISMRKSQRSLDLQASCTVALDRLEDLPVAIVLLPSAVRGLRRLAPHRQLAFDAYLSDRAMSSDTTLQGQEHLS